VLNKIRELDLDVIHFFTPGQIGLMGITRRTKQILFLWRTMPPMFMSFPSTTCRLFLPFWRCCYFAFTFKVDRHDVREIMKLYLPHRSATAWAREIIAKVITMVYSKCDVVIAYRAKASSSSKVGSTRLYVQCNAAPDGVDAIPAPRWRSGAFRKAWV